MRQIYTMIIMLFFITTLNAQKLVEIQISDEYDDMEEYLPAGDNEQQDSIIGELDYESSLIELGYKDSEGVTPQLCGFRFDDILIGQGREILSAYIEFTINTDKYIDTCSFIISAEDAADADAFAEAASSGGPGGGGGTPPSGGSGPGDMGGSSSSSSEPEYDSLELSARTKLAETISWKIKKNESSATDAKIQTPDISSLIQQLIDKEAWDSSNAMAFYVKSDTGAREVYAYESDEANAATLYIRYVLNHADSVKIIADSIQALKDSLRTVSIDSVLNKHTSSLNEEDYTIPTWTLLKRAEVTFESDFDNDTKSVEALLEAVDSLQSSEMPYII